MKRYRLKKSAAIFLFLILLLIIAVIMLIISLLSTKSYSLEYSIDDYNISENYLKEDKTYYYEITYDKVKYNFIYESKYLKNRKLITGINKTEYEDYICLEIESKQISTNPLCSKEKELIDYRLVPEELELDRKTDEENEKTYENYTIYNQNNKILVWNYKGFNYLENEDIKHISIFSKDIYDISLVGITNNYLIIPDYEQSYTFNKIYIVNLSNLKVDTWKIKYDISFDSYILGSNDKSIYLLDKKNKTEYELVPHKKKMRIIATDNRYGIIYKNGEQEKIRVNNLVNSKQEFTYLNNYKYTLDNNTLYLSYLDSNIKTKISDKYINNIININKDTIYYLVEDTLYRYNLEYGETKIMTYSEWKYNYQNSIIIYNEN